MSDLPDDWQLENDQVTADGEIIDIASRRKTPIHGMNLTKGLKVPRNETQVVSSRIPSTLARHVDEIVAGRRIPGILTRSDYVNTALFYFTEQLKIDYPDVMGEGVVARTTAAFDMLVLKYHGMMAKKSYTDAVEMFDDYFDDPIMLNKVLIAIDGEIEKEMTQGIGSQVFRNKMLNLKNKVALQLDRLAQRDQ